MRYRLKRWWNCTSLWPACFAILFGKDVADIDFKGTFDIYNLMTYFTSDGTAKVEYPGVLPVLIALLESGLRSVTKNQEDPDSPLAAERNGADGPGAADPSGTKSRSVSWNTLDGLPGKSDRICGKNETNAGNRYQRATQGAT